MMGKKIRCACCKRWVRCNPKVNNQRYCSKRSCQNERKRQWEKRKMRLDADYRLNRSDSQRRWRQGRPDYYARYRESHPTYCRDNRMKQQARNRVRVCRRLIAKTDTLQLQPSEIKRISQMSSSCPVIAKTDALFEKTKQIQAVMKHMPVIAKKDSIDTEAQRCK